MNWGFNFGGGSAPAATPPQDATRRQSPLSSLLEEVVPGDQPSYELCKLLYTTHPIGTKIIEAPLQLVFSQTRAISGIPEAVKKQFETTWRNASADAVIKNTMRLSKMTGVSTLTELEPGVFNVFDSLNTSGSFGSNLDPLSPQFLRTPSVRVNGRVFGPGECIVLHNGPPVYLDFVESGYGYTGRSVYHAALFDLASYIDVMHANRLIAQKSGVLVAKMKTMAAAANQMAQQIAGFKRNLLKEARTYNVIQVGIEDDVESLNLQHSVESANGSKESILDSIAAAIGMPAIILKSETLAQGLGGSGAEDSKVIANYVSEEREAIEPLYQFLIPRIQKMAWTPEFYASFQATDPEYADIPFETAFYEWIESFLYEWPDFLREQKSEKAKAAEATMNMLEKTFNLLNGTVSPDDRRMLCQYVMDTANSDELKEFLPVPLELNLDGDFSMPAPTDIKETVSEDEKDSPDSESETPHDSE
ncbi:anti-CBASS protein Acb1 family protein [Paraburkholderia tropica]|uniref:anti-CBASS protein Acb1 family protein n=1 Tax=Paraburkholderia tropica TaxID=92647 RepID=UPI002AB26B30|nr:anti-CBASS Acb1 family protein [Paraburkholderia tropica]